MLVLASNSTMTEQASDVPFSFIVTLIRIAVFTTVIIMTLVNAKMETTVRAAVEEQKKNEANKENEGKAENQ